MATILDVTHGAVAYAGRLLAEQGHRVLRPVADGSAAPAWLPAQDPIDAPNAGFHHAGKEVRAVRSLEELAALAAGCDGVIADEGFDDVSRLATENGSIVIVLLERDGPEICLAARSGLMTLTGDPRTAPVMLGGHSMDAVAGTFAAIALIAGLYARGGSGRGSVIRLSMLDCLRSLGEQAAVEYFVSGAIARRIGYRGAVTAISGAIPCRDGYVMISVPTSAEAWRQFVEWVGDPELIADSALENEADRRARQDDIMARIDRWSAARSTAEVIAGAQARHIPATPVARVEELATDEQLLARGYLRRDPVRGGTEITGAIATMLRRSWAQEPVRVP